MDIAQIPSQVQALNKILASKDYSFISTNNLNEAFFYTVKNEFNYIKNHYDKYKVVPDVLTFLSVFPEFPIFEVTEPDTYLISELTKEYNLALVGTKYNKIKRMVEDEDERGTVNLCLELAESLVKCSAVQSADLLTDRSRLVQYMDKKDGKGYAYISTGFAELDALIGGIDPLEENMVIVARTGVGKSWTLLKMAVAAALQGKNVGLYSGEMSRSKVGYRIDTLLANALSNYDPRIGLLNNKNLMRGLDYGTSRNYEAYFDIVEELLKKGDLGQIKVITPNDIAGPVTVDALRAFVEKDHIEILFIDQYSLLEDTSYAKSMNEKVANISKDIKKLQVLKKIPIVSVAQMNRSKNEDGSKDTTQIGLSDRIGQDATCVLMLDKVAKDQGYSLTIETTKVRDGGDNKKLTYEVDLNLGTFTYIPDADSGVTEEMSDAMVSEYERPIL